MSVRNVRIDGLIYPLEKEAENRPLSNFGLINRLALSDEGIFRIFQIGDNASALAGQSELSGRFSDSSQMMALPRIVGVSFEAADAYRDLNDPEIAAKYPWPDQVKRRVSNAISRVTDALAIYCYAAGLIARRILENLGAALQFVRMGDLFSLISDTTDAEMAAQDWTRAHRVVQYLKGKNASQKLIDRFEWTERIALLKLVKSVLAIAIGIFSVWVMLFNTALISATATTVLALSVALTAAAVILYRHSMPHSPVDMLKYSVANGKV